MHRVAAGELPETLRLARPAAVVAFAKRDALAPGYAEALGAARRAGFGAVLRLAGGRAAIFHEGTLELAHAVPDADPRSGIRARFDATSQLIARALRRLGVDARVGELPGEYCPGRWSVNGGGVHKLAGIAQRVVKGGSHTGAIIVVEDAARVSRGLEDVYRALGLDWNPATVGAVADELPSGTGLGDPWAAVRDALLAEYAERYRLLDGELGADTLALARELAAEHRPPEAASASAQAGRRRRALASRHSAIDSGASGSSSSRSGSSSAWSAVSTARPRDSSTQ
jgi:octanoyl-[GcvH]:protein N-octanoyltransferase